MNQFRRILFLLMMVVVTQAAQAALGVTRPLLANGPGVGIELQASGENQWLAFTGSADQRVVLNVAKSTFADACSVDMSIIDESDKMIWRSSCTARNGPLPMLALPADGRYRLHAVQRGNSGGTLRVALTLPSTATLATPQDCVVMPLALDNIASGSWDSSCPSVTYTNHDAQYYTITVPTSEVITITLTSTTDTWLVLRSGSSTTGPLVATDNDSGPGTNAQIARTLSAGTYTIEATTNLANQTGSFTLVARTNTAPCFATLVPNKTINSSWTTDCSSVTYTDHYSKYYTLSVPTDEVVTITLSSATDAFLVLRSGSSQLGPLVVTDNDSGAGKDAQIARTLTAGVYTIEATTNLANQMGNFSIVARTDEKPCYNKLSLDVVASSQWTSQCTSVTYSDHYAKYYTITVPQDEVVTITLTSVTDSFLVLRSGTSQLGPLVVTDNDSGPGTNAQIARSLSAGTYTIEATTNLANQQGDFQLVARTNIAPCFHTLALDTLTRDQWTDDCSSVTYTDHYAKYYTLNVPAGQVITITLDSTTDSFLVLRSGAGQLGSLVVTDNDSGAGTDAQIARSLAEGTYTIEATTNLANQKGTYSIVARTDSAPCFTALTLNRSVSSQWTSACTSVTYADHYAKYYSLTVPKDEIVTIGLSSTIDDFLVLRSGTSQLGQLVVTDNDSGAGTNASIARSLTAGAYTIEATTNLANLMGPFSIVARTNTAPCFDSIGVGETASTSWIPACTSVTYTNHYSKYYTLTVPVDQTVTITLSSTTDAFLVLRSGSSQLGPLVVTDNDSGPGTDAQIVRSLAAGTYTIEATTNLANQMGDFTLSTVP